MVAITTPLTTATGVNDIFIIEDNHYALIATTSGIDVVDLHQGKVISSGTLPSAPNCITADWQKAGGNLYIGTSADGVFAMSWVRVREPLSDFTGSLVQRFTTVTSPPVSSNTINDLDVLFGQLLIGTTAGVDYIVNDTESSTRVISGGVQDVHLTSTGGGYWTTNSGASQGSVEVNYDLVTTTGAGVIGVDFEYNTLSTPVLPAEPAVDITISESLGNLTVLAFATSSGVTVIEENPGNESISNVKDFTFENATGVDFSNTATYFIGNLYTTTTAMLRVIELETDTISGTHTLNEGTRGQTLISETISIIRTTNIA